VFTPQTGTDKTVQYPLYWGLSENSLDLSPILFTPPTKQDSLVLSVSVVWTRHKSDGLCTDLFMVEMICEKLENEKGWRMVKWWYGTCMVRRSEADLDGAQSTVQEIYSKACSISPIAHKVNIFCFTFICYIVSHYICIKWDGKSDLYPLDDVVNCTETPQNVASSREV